MQLLQFACRGREPVEIALNDTFDLGSIDGYDHARVGSGVDARRDQDYSPP